ncbi:MAG: four helix bundle protein [Patescibacteria group bacterium]
MTKTVNYDLEERTTKFSEKVIKFAKKISVNPISQRIIPQLIASSTSIGANYCEADDAESSKDFKHKIGICKKEARETKYWLRVIANITDLEELKSEARTLWKEAKELHLIFNAIYRKVNEKQRQN